VPTGRALESRVIGPVPRRVPWRAAGTRPGTRILDDRLHLKDRVKGGCREGMARLSDGSVLLEPGSQRGFPAHRGVWGSYPHLSEAKRRETPPSPRVSLAAPARFSPETRDKELVIRQGACHQPGALVTVSLLIWGIGSPFRMARHVLSPSMLKNQFFPPCKLNKEEPGSARAPRVWSRGWRRRRTVSSCVVGQRPGVHWIFVAPDLPARGGGFDPRHGAAQVISG
jgi:hypothetical protein